AFSNGCRLSGGRPSLDGLGGSGPPRRNDWLSTSGYQPRCIAISRSHSVLVRRCEITRPSEWHLLQVDSASAFALYLKSMRRRSASHEAGFASSGASPRFVDRYLTTCRAVEGSMFKPLSAAMRWMIVCHPSGVLRWNEMRDICPLSSGRWHEPHAFCTVASEMGMPSSGLAVGAAVGCGAWAADSMALISRTVAAAKTCLSMGPRLAVILTQATRA